MASTELAVRHTVRFGGGARPAVTLPLHAPLPKDSLDPRWKACVQHRTACDCREAQLAEQLAEYRAELREAKEVFNNVLHGHQTFAWTPEGERDLVAECKCTGCQIARRLHFRQPWDVDDDRAKAGLELRPW